MSDNIIKNDDKLKSDILRDFHSQFAQKQNHHQTTVITVFTAFIALIAVFVYATLNQETYISSAETKLVINHPYIVSDMLYHGLSLLLCLLFSFVFIYICQVGYTFRRDQYIVNRIRRQEGLDKDIFEGYGQPKNTCFFLPDFYLLLLLFILLLTVAVMLWVFILIHSSNYFKLLFIFPYMIMLRWYLVYLFKHRNFISKSKNNTKTDLQKDG